MKKLKLGVATFATSLIVVSSFVLFLTLKATETPLVGNYFSTAHPEWPPMPANFWGVPQVEVSNRVFLLDDEATFSRDTETPPLPGEGGGGDYTNTDWSLGTGGRPFTGDCTGHLLPPVYQGSNVVLSITGATSGDKYDLYSATNLNVANWTYMG